MTSRLSSMIEALRAAGEPTRLRVLALLRQRDLSVGELVQVLEVILHHQLVVHNYLELNQK